MRRLFATAVPAATVAAIALLGSAPSASAAQDTACQRAGMSFLKDNGLFTTVARGGLPISLAVGAGVMPRAGTDVASLPDPLPLSVVLADHRAGDKSLVIYPWC